jgi:UDP-N-acetylglucosamine 2-epimerase (non-hydrolysing)
MGRKKILLVFGTRPEAIKMAPLYKALKGNSEHFDVQLCVTAQHREMLDQVLELFDIVPDVDLNLMRPGQSLFDTTSAVLKEIGEILSQQRPDLVLVHGDTTTSMAAALAAFYSGVEVGHVEAGLRTYDLQSPFPEEFNRQVTGKISSWHFAPTQLSRANLLAEKVDDSRIVVTGNTVIDALHWVLQRIENDAQRRAATGREIDKGLPFDWRNTPYIVITGHRRENFGDGFAQICEAIRRLAEKYPQLHFVYPVHFNPNVRQPVANILSGLSNVHLIEPLAYEPFLYLLKHCYLVLTDSGGIQEEAPSLGIPVLVMRDTTERPEAIEAGTVRLVGANALKIIEGVSHLVEDPNAYSEMSKAHNPYGDGTACFAIVEKLKVV